MGIRPCMGGNFWIWVICCSMRLLAEWNFILIYVYVYKALDHIQRTYTERKKIKLPFMEGDYMCFALTDVLHIF